MSAADIDGRTPAHYAAYHGHVECLRALEEAGAGASMSAMDKDARTPAHDAAENGHVECLRALEESRAGASLSAMDNGGRTPAHYAAYHGHVDCLRALEEAGAGSSLSAVANNGRTPAHYAAENGHVECLRALEEAGAGASLSAAANGGWTPAHEAAENGHVECLRALEEAGAGASLSTADNDGQTPAHYAAENGHVECLRALEQYGAGASLSAVANDGRTPAHYAARQGHVECLRVLHYSLSQALAPKLQALEGLEAFTPTSLVLVAELRSIICLSAFVPQESVPMDAASKLKLGMLAMFDDAARHPECLRALVEIGGGNEWLVHAVQERTGRHQRIGAVTQPQWSTLLSNPSLLDLRTKQLWLAHRLEQVVSTASAAQLDLVAVRGDALAGLCEQLGVAEGASSGQLLMANAEVVAPAPLAVQFSHENGVGDGVRREWFGIVSSELTDPARGLFRSKDGGRTLHPNPDSQLAAGADHLAYFCLLGRITGLAIYHKEPLPASWSIAFIKAVFGFPVALEDVESVDPELYEKRVVYVRDGTYASRDGIVLADLGLVFVDDSNAEAYSAANAEVELKPGGADLEVTEENKEEYLQLFAKHRLLDAIQPQIEAFLTGLAVFLSAELLAQLRQCCTVGELQLLICGMPTVDTDDWQAHTQYTSGYTEDSPVVRWFWTVVEEMSPEERGKLLHFCTGSARPPATGFAHLQGYQGNLRCFELQRGDRESSTLPTASTCFNMLTLPEYGSKAQLQSKLKLALDGSVGFDEGATAG
eukprot:SAG31_NODE_2044_length_6580_cov_2.757445_7_plen_769_part_00